MTTISRVISEKRWAIAQFLFLSLVASLTLLLPIRYFAVLIASAAIIGIGSIILIRHTRFVLIAFLIALPFYPLTVFAIEKKLGLVGNQILFLRSIRDVFVISVLFLLIFKRSTQNPAFLYRAKPLGLFALLLMIFPLPYLFIGNSSLFTGLFSLREGLIYLVLFFIGRWSWFSFENIKTLAKGILFSGVFISAFGLIQAYILGPEFLSNFREIETIFVSAPGFWGVQRVVGTFAHAPELGTYLVMLCPIAIWLYQTRHHRRRIAKVVLLGILGLFLITLAATFARSAWIGLVVALMVVLRGRRSVKLLFLFIPLIIILAFVTPASSYILKTLSGNEPSFNYHIDTLKSSLDFLFKHPLGIGLGQVGVAAIRFGNSAPFFEGFYFNLAGELGWIYLGLYWIFLLLVFLGLVHVERNLTDPALKKWARAMQGAFAGWAITGFFLPVMTSREIAFTLWFLIGVTLNLPLVLKAKTKGGSYV